MFSFTKSSQDSKYIPAPLFQSPEVFMHGTNSSVLALLDKTEMQLISPIEMIRKYQLAPLSGEISGGGLENVQSDTNTCFGELNNESSYSLKRLMNQYTTKKYHLNLDWKNLQKGCFTSINIFLVYLTHAKELGKSNSDLIGENDIQELYNQINTTIQYFYFVMLLGKHIHPNIPLMKTLEPNDRSNVCDAIYTHLTYENICKKIRESKLNIEEIYKNPTTESIKQVAKLLEIPKTSIIKSGFMCIDMEVTLPHTNLFSLTASYPTHGVVNYYQVGYLSYRFPQNVRGYTINNFLEKLVSGEVSQDFCRKFEAQLLSHIEVLRDRFALLKTIIEKDYQDTLVKDDAFYRNPFPLIFICEDKTKVSLLSEYSGEYRARGPLKIGREISMIATDSPLHQKMVLDYFKKRDIDVKVILFSQLENAKALALKSDAARMADEVSSSSKQIRM